MSNAAPTTAPAPSKVQLPLNPFPRASDFMWASNVKAGTLGSSEAPNGGILMSEVEVPTLGGFLGAIELVITGTASGNTAAVAFNADAPFNVISGLGFISPSGDSLVDISNSGFDYYLMRKYGFAQGSPPDDAMADPDYSAVSGSGANAGSFKFRLFIPIRVREIDCFGYQGNGSATDPFKLNATLAAASAVFSTAPSSGYSVSWQLNLGYRAAPPATTPLGQPNQTTPNGYGSYQTWQRVVANVLSGNSEVDISKVVGDPQRAMIFVLRDASGARTDADWPAVLRFLVNGSERFKFDTQRWENFMEAAYGYHATSKDVANGLNTGVYVIPFLNEFFSNTLMRMDAGFDSIFFLTSGSRLLLNGLDWGSNAAKLSVLTNNIKTTDPTSLYGY